MSLRINSNFAAISDGALRSQHSYQNKMGKAITRVSTGKRVNRASDDVVAYNASKRIKADAVGYSALGQTIQNSSVYLNAADTATAQVVDTVTALREKALAYGALSETDQQGAAGIALNTEYDALRSELSGLVTNFAISTNSSLLQGSNSYTFAVDLAGTNYVTGWDGTNITGAANAVLGDDIVTAAGSGAATAKSALDSIASEHANIGADVGILETLTEYFENMAAIQDEAYSDLTEVDMAKEMTAYVKNNIYSQASQAMIAQANQSLAQVLNLLQ